MIVSILHIVTAVLLIIMSILNLYLLKEYRAKCAKSRLDSYYIESLEEEINRKNDKILKLRSKIIILKENPGTEVKQWLD